MAQLLHLMYDVTVKQPSWTGVAYTGPALSWFTRVGSTRQLVYRPSGPCAIEDNAT